MDLLPSVLIKQECYPEIYNTSLLDLATNNDGAYRYIYLLISAKVNRVLSQRL